MDKSIREMAYTEVMKALASNPNRAERAALIARLKEVDPMETALPKEIKCLVP